MKILIVDDSRAMRLLIARALRKAGLGSATFVEAADGNEALAAVQQAAPDLVISDFNMPGMSGLDFLRTARTNGSASRFGLVTSEASAELKQQAIDAGASFVIIKPFTPVTLIETLNPVLAELGCGNLSADDESPKEYVADAQFPTAAHVGGILRELFRRAVSAAPTTGTGIAPGAPRVVAEYRRNDDGSLLACGICDIPWAVRAGAALTMIPPTAAEEAIARRQVADTVAENLHEVLNVMSRLFNGAGSSRVSLGPVHLPGKPLPPDLNARITKPGTRLDLKMDFEGYGNGNLTLLSFNPEARAA